jgi:hypothetical protein
MPRAPVVDHVPMFFGLIYRLRQNRHYIGRGGVVRYAGSGAEGHPSGYDDGVAGQISLALYFIFHFPFVSDRGSSLR